MAGVKRKEITAFGPTMVPLLNENFKNLGWILSGNIDYFNIKKEVAEKWDSKATPEEVQEQITDFSTSLGDMAFEDAVELAKLGTTIIEGGYLATGLVHAGRIDTGVLNAARVSVGPTSTFSPGYDPSAKVSPGDLGALAWENAVQKAMLGSTIIQGGYIVTGMIDASRINVGTLNADRIGAGSITTDKIRTGAVKTDQIDTWAITSGKIAAGAVWSEKLSAGAVTADKLAATIILGSTIWAGSNRVKLDNSGITVYGENLRFYDGGTYAGGVTAIGSSLGIATSGNLSLSTTSSARSISLVVAGSAKIMATSSEIALNQRLYAVGPYTNILYDIRPYNASTWLGTSSNKFSAGYFNSLPGCPLPTSNSGIGIMKKIKPPEIREGKQGVRHYFLDEDFPSEMKCKMADKDEKGNIVEREEEEIEYIRTIGVLVQATRELVERVEILEAQCNPDKT